MQVVTEPTILDGSLAAVNNFGFGGTNGHALLESHSKLKINNGMPTDSLPRLVVMSGRTEEAVNVVIQDVRVNLLTFHSLRMGGCMLCV